MRRGEVARGQRRKQREFAGERADGDCFGERVRVDPAGSPPPRTPSTSSPSACVGSFVPPPTVPTSSEAMETETYRPSSRASAVVMAFAPSDDLRHILPEREEDGGDDVCDVGVEAETGRLCGADEVLSGVEFGHRFGGRMQAVFDQLAGNDHVRGDGATTPLDGVDGCGFLIRAEVAREGHEGGGVSSSTSSQAARVAMVTMFIPIASFVS